MEQVSQCKSWVVTVVASLLLTCISHVMVRGKIPSLLIYISSQLCVLTGGCHRFVKGHSILIGFVGMAFFLTLFMTTYLRWENARRDRVALEKGQVTTSQEQQLEEAESADGASWFRYTV